MVGGGGGTAKYPGGDFLQTGPVTGENDLKLLVATFESSVEGRLVLRRSSANVQVWSSATKGAAHTILVGDTYAANIEGNGKKTWNLPDDWAAFDAGMNYLYVEGRALGTGTVKLSYEFGGAEIWSDVVRYTFIAADCGRQPILDTRRKMELNRPKLVRCEYSITLGASFNYNCLGWAIGLTNRYIWGRTAELRRATGVDIIQDGTDNMTFTIARTFLENGHTLPDGTVLGGGYVETASAEGATIAVFMRGGLVRHFARKSFCACGAGKWDMWESKIGDWDRMEHVMDQVEGVTYGKAEKFFKLAP